MNIPTYVLALMALVVSANATQTKKFLRSRADSSSERRSLQNGNNFPFIEENGMVVIEAESGPIIQPWYVEQIYTGYTGSGHIRFDGNSIYGGSVAATMSYFIQINNPGPYTLTLRGRKNNTEYDLSNDCYFKMVGYPGRLGNHVKTYLGGRPRIFRWDVEMEWGEDKFVPIYNLNAKGTYELQLSGRSKHFVIDRIVLYNSNFIGERQAETTLTPESRRMAGPGAPPSVFQGLELTTAGPGTYSEIQDVGDGDIISLGAVGTSTGLLLKTFGDVGSVRFEYDGQTRSEGSAPFSVGGGSGDSVDPMEYLSYAGVKTVVTTIFNDEGDILASETVTFTMIDATLSPTVAPQTAAPTRTSPTTSPTPPPPTNAPTSSAPVSVPVGVLDSLKLTTAGKPVDTVVQTLVNGDYVDQLEVGKRLSIIAEVSVPVKTVKFFYGGKVWTEGLAAYAMAGNVGTRNLPVQYLTTTGTKQVVVKAYDAAGTEVGVQDITFTIGEGALPTEAPVATTATGDASAAPATAPPTTSPTNSPTAPPTGVPTTSPTDSPTTSPTTSPIDSATASPTTSPTDSPTASPTKATTSSPTGSPTTTPTAGATISATATQTSEPTVGLTSSPTANPTDSPTASPTVSPTVGSTASPTEPKITAAPVTSSPTLSPTAKITAAPVTSSPTLSPTVSPTEPKVTAAPVTSSPTLSPTGSPPSGGPVTIIESLDVTTAGSDDAVILIKDFKSGDVIHLGTTGTDLSILANINPAASEVAKVTFEYDGLTWYEGLAPYAMHGNWNAINHRVDYLSTPGGKLLTVRAHDSSMAILETAIYTFLVLE